MRVIAGKYKGRTLRMPKGVLIRPTQDRVREAIFNIIQKSVSGSTILDLYAGSGAFGIEALSRGARLAVFVDIDRKCARTIKENLSFIENSEKSYELIRKETIDAISAFGNDSRKFDIIFMDPPYYKKGFVDRKKAAKKGKQTGSPAKNSLIKIEACDIVSRYGFVIVEHFAKDGIPDNIGRLSLFKKSKYGDTAVSFYRKAVF